MTERNYDPEFSGLLSLLPTIADLSSLESIQQMRESRADFYGEPVERDDVLKQDQRVPGPAGAPEVPVRV